MTRSDKLMQRFQGRPRDFTWSELVRLLRYLGYMEAKPGKTGGSRRRFVHPHAEPITLHEPHAGNPVQDYVISELLRTLTEEELI